MANFSVTETTINEWVAKHPYQYIYFTHQHFTDLPLATSYFERKFEADRATMQSRAMMSQVEMLQTQLAADGYTEAQVLEIVAGLDNGKLLAAAASSIGESLNKLIEDFYNNTPDGQDIETYMQALTTRKSSYAGLLSSGPASSASLKQFFNFILQGLDLMGTIDSEILDGFTQLGKKLSSDGQQFVFRGTNKLNNRVKVASEEDRQRAQQIIGYLDKAAGQLAKNGSVSRESFMGVLNNVFSGTLGENLAKVILEKSLTQADAIVTQELLKNPNITMTGKNTFTQIGQETVTINGKSVQGKVDLNNRGAFTIEVKQNGNSFDIELSSNISVKTQSQDNTEIKIVDKRPIGTIYTDAQESWYALNILAHRLSGDGYAEAYNTLRSSMAASFIDDWLTGSGQSYASGEIDKAQYLMLNGKIYPMAEIMNKICNSIYNGKSRGLHMSIQGRDTSVNKWIGDRKSINLALERSYNTKEAINKFVVTMHFNSNMLNA